MLLRLATCLVGLLVTSERAAAAAGDPEVRARCADARAAASGLGGAWTNATCQIPRSMSRSEARLTPRHMIESVMSIAVSPHVRSGTHCASCNVGLGIFVVLVTGMAVVPSSGLERDNKLCEISRLCRD